MKESPQLVRERRGRTSRKGAIGCTASFRSTLRATVKQLHLPKVAGRMLMFDEKNLAALQVELEKAILPTLLATFCSRAVVQDVRELQR